MSQGRGFERQVVRETGKAERHARNIELSGNGIMDGTHGAAFPQVGVLRRFRHRQDRGNRNPELLHMSDRTMNIGKGGLQPLFDNLDDLIPMFKAQHIVAIPLMLHQLGFIHGGAQVLPVMQKGHNDNRPACGAKDTGRTDIAQMPSGPSRIHLALGTAVLMHVDLMIMVVHVQQADIEMLALARAVAVAQGGHDSQGAMHARTDITHPNPRKIWGFVRVADHGGDPGVCLGNIVIARFAGQRPLLAQSRD